MSPFLTLNRLWPRLMTLQTTYWYWRVYYGRLDLVSVEGIDVDDPDWKQIGQGSTEVTAAEVAKFDPTPLQNDGYAILIAAYDTNGRGYAKPVIVNVEGNAKLGQFSLDLTDLSIRWPVSRSK